MLNYLQFLQIQRGVIPSLVSCSEHTLQTTHYTSLGFKITAVQLNEHTMRAPSALYLSTLLCFDVRVFFHLRLVLEPRVLRSDYHTGDIHVQHATILFWYPVRVDGVGL